jgi:hypothetical protein
MSGSPIVVSGSRIARDRSSTWATARRSRVFASRSPLASSITDFPISTPRPFASAAPRRFTQEISRYVYDRSTSTRTRSFVGLAYRSRLGDEFQNWAIFESADGALPVTKPPDILPIEWDDPDLRLALDRLGIRLRMR